MHKELHVTVKRIDDDRLVYFYATQDELDTLELIGGDQLVSTRLIEKDEIALNHLILEMLVF